VDLSRTSLFVTGTDTGVGKTLVTALLALRLRARGVRVGVMKPFATGCERPGGELVSEDAAWLREVTGVTDDLAAMNPVRFEEPLAPLVAARRAGASGRDLRAEALAGYEALRGRYDQVIVEGIGGLLVPLQPGEGDGGPYTCADFAGDLGLPVVVVARRALGTINHTALTCRVPLRAPARVEGIVFCDAQPVAEGDVAALTSPGAIEEMTGIARWGSVPFLRDLSRGVLAEAAERFLTRP
jgi:dethiobiotin synthetase